jgi:hypothetical protein
MSLSNPKQVNPATKFIEFKGDSGEFFYYDKDTTQKVQMKMPIYFVVLDQLSSIKGYNQQLKVGIYSNEIRYLKDENLTVKSFKGGINITGKYQDIKDAALREGGKYCKSVYAMLITGDQYELVNFQFHGAAFSGAGENSRSGWVNFKGNTEQIGIVVKETEPGKIGAVNFQAPIFEKGWLLADRPKVLQAATEMDKKLQDYLKSYLSKVIEKNITENETGMEPASEDHLGEFEADRWGMIPTEKEVVQDNGASDDLPF